ncbi:MAG: DNA cytosine methyltransferase [Clostridia bacterium]|nr:DNA cytosine methyltransferase [Clostridia bacterium]MBR4537235.1 DNA cytosine methyltransferase [Clostridia bacterium]MBR4540534.1 DNA cytosine methyltransferase [Clostridia bacterium]
MKVLVACEESQTVCLAFRERGHEAFSADIQHCALYNHIEWHIVEDVRNIISGNCSFITVDGKPHIITGPWDLIIAHPPCTYLSNPGANHLFLGTERIQRQKETFRLMNEERVRLAIQARDFFFAMLNAPCEHVAVENPIPSTIWQLPSPSQVIQPFFFGDPFKKKTYLWLRGLPKLVHTNMVEPTGLWVDGGHAKQTKMQNFGFRDAKKRSKTFPGIAQAMAEQWGV